ncbi:hypothetical protein BEI59_28680 [Eisenbergiella tayi]|uniref:Uncharacterized protein n=1 Tax=Eisenbergiella tayi TaxID=1432052 RepID=A0A1E3U9J2_9FIRM|nr:hypothetical protein BEI59_28680 [Eisenbergiella tayi]ODR45512.1 hypothetical protein BEI62_02455 [Eisenbergiella tayi]ODR52827.1 hypothetical protein BEI63_19300 [Eisenbergiella tayi]
MNGVFVYAVDNYMDKAGMFCRWHYPTHFWTFCPEDDAIPSTWLLWIYILRSRPLFPDWKRAGDKVELAN